MKIIRNSICYVDYEDLTRRPIPRCVANEMKGQPTIEDDLVTLTGKDSIEYIRSRQDILDYDEVAGLSPSELNDLYEEALSKLNYYSIRMLGTPPELRRSLYADEEYMSNNTLYSYRTKDLKTYRDNKAQIDRRIIDHMNPDKAPTKKKGTRHKVSL